MASAVSGPTGDHIVSSDEVKVDVKPKTNFGVSDSQNVNKNSEPLPHPEAIVGDTFTTVSLSEQPGPQKKKKVPRRILHFSDGILEEYSTDEEADGASAHACDTKIVDPKTMKWLPWFWHKVTVVATTTLGYADFCGEKLAWFFGITSPKYQTAIDEYYRIKAEEEEERKERAREEEEILARTEEGMTNASINSETAPPSLEKY